MKTKIIHNKIQCKNCGEILESIHVHDFVSCSCFKKSDGKTGCACDGGKEYLRRLAQSQEDYIDLSETRPYTAEEQAEYERLLEEQKKTIYSDEAWEKIINLMKKRDINV